ncbi:MFS transporter [Nocardioides marmoriginsengisoli]|uniref:MFS transporter n=1 Tax=Nocardioides marmoriginsengisoli TaxID=661483 RepID=UPI001609FF1B|nr:MFS transporter [Nocardioides marmoriginsengisoli]
MEFIAQTENAETHAGPKPRKAEPAGWFAVCSVMSASFALVLSEFIPLGLLDELSRDLGVTEGRAGLFVVLPGLAACIGAPLVTVLAGSTDRRRVLLLLSATVLASNIWVVFAPTFAVALIGRAALGFAVGGFWTIGPPTATRFVADRHATRAASLVIGGISMATVISLPLGAWIVVVTNWRWAFVVAAAFAFVAVCLEIVAVPRLAPVGSVRWSTLLGVFSTRKARQCLGITVAAFGAHFATYTYVTPFVNQTGLPESALPVVLLAFGLVGVVSNLVGGWVLDSRLRPVFSGALLILGVALIVMPMTESLPALTVALIFTWGISWGLIPLSLQIWILAATPQARDGDQAMFVSVLQLSLAGGSALGGVLVDWLDVRTDYFLAGVVALLAGLATTWWLHGVQGRGAT